MVDVLSQHFIKLNSSDVKFIPIHFFIPPQLCTRHCRLLTKTFSFSTSSILKVYANKNIVPLFLFSRNKNGQTETAHNRFFYQKWRWSQKNRTVPLSNPGVEYFFAYAGVFCLYSKIQGCASFSAGIKSISVCLINVNHLIDFINTGICSVQIVLLAQLLFFDNH